jgi:hypothetical protein
VGCVRQAVLEFDEEVRAPWRPPLVSGAAIPGPSTTTSAPRPSSDGSPRVGACRPATSVVGRESVARPVQRATPGPDVRRPGPGGRRPGPGGRRPGSGGRPSPLVGVERRGLASVPSGRLRPTRRGRRLLVVLSLCGGVVVGSWLGPLLWGAGAEEFRLAGATSVVVEPGDTVWSIASAVTEGGDVRITVNEIQRLNDLEGAVLMPGQVLRLP